PPPIDAVNPDSLVRHRPDVMSAERQLASRSALVGAAQAEYLPRVVLAGSTGFTSATSTTTVGRPGTRPHTLGPIRTWPALRRGRVKAGVDAARGAETGARAHYEQAQLTARADIETAVVSYRAARARLGFLEDAAGASERAAVLARLRFSEGAADFLQVLD